jgi:putative hydrolase of the HAD superfamily
MLPQAILFDLDDTILAFGALAEPAWRKTCEVHAERSGLFEAEPLFRAIGEVRRWYWSDPDRHRSGRLDLDATRRKIVSLAFERLGVDGGSVADQIADEYSARREQAIHLFPGAQRTLEVLTERGVLLALVTNGEAAKQRSKIERFHLAGFFATILMEGELGYGKPDERVYRRALDDLGVEPKDAWSVGDRLEWDVAGPQRLGIFGVWNDFKRQGLPSASSVVPDRIIHSISELVE